MSYHNPDFETPVAPWVYFLCAGGLFAYQTLDNIDGKQARRTKSSSPLGELFDHVSDAMGVGTMITTVGASCRVGPVVTLGEKEWLISHFASHELLS
jgi:phosphatidylglycerophosphate synthase